MKKIFIILIILLCPVVVLADEIVFNVYNAKVINKNGISYQGWENEKYVDKKIPYNANIMVSFHTYKWYDEDAGINRVTDAAYGYFGKDSFDINVKDIDINLNSFNCTICNDEYNYYNEIFYQKNTNSQKIKILNESGLKLKVGPASNFNDIDVIVPYNADLKINYYLGLGGLDDIDYWANVDYNGINGFVNLINNKSAYYSTDDIYMTIDNTSIILDNKVVGTIPANTEISPNYVNYDYSNYYINYEGVSGFIDGKSLAYGMDFYNEIIIKYDHKLLSKPNKNANVITNIPEGSQINYRFRYFNESDNPSKYLDCVYAKYNKTNGWVCFDKGEIPGYVEHTYKWSIPTTTKTQTITKIQDKDLVSDNSINLILICTIIIFAGIIISIIVRNNILKKKREKYIEEISKIEEDKD